MTDGAPTPRSERRRDRPRILPAMLRRLAFALATFAAAAPAAADPWGFAWAGRIERDGAPLFDPGAEPEARRAAVSALRPYDPALTRRFILHALDDDDPAVRLEAAQVAGQGKMVEAVPRLIDWLADPDRATRRVASDMLGMIADASGTSALVRTLGDLDSDVRLGAVNALAKIGQRGDRSVVVPLISRVNDEKTEVRRAAIEALRGIGDRRAVAAVVAAFGDGNIEVRKAAVITAGKLGDPAAITALTRMLDDAQPDVRNVAIAALGDLGAADATDDLIRLLRAGGDASAPAGYALGQIAAGGDRDAADRAVRALVASLVDPSARPVVQEALRRAGAVAVPALVAHLDGRLAGDPGAAVDLLAEVGDARATEALIAELDRKRLSVARITAALAKTGDRRALVPVLGLIADPDPTVRTVAMGALGALIGNDRRAIDALIERLGDDQEDVQVLACGYLARLHATAAGPALAALAAAPRSPRLRRAAIDALGAVGHTPSAPVLLAALADPDPILARAAADALAYLADPGTARQLEAIARHPGPSQTAVLRAWGAALRDRPDPRARAILIELAQTAPTLPALAAIAGLASSGDRAARPALAELVERGAPERQRAAAWALGELADGPPPAPIAKALVGALEAKDDRIAAAAAWALLAQPTESAAASLRRLARHGGWAARVNATAALARHGGADAVGDLVTLLAHASPLVRGNAAWALGARATDAALPATATAALAHALADDVSPWVRGHAARALWRRAPVGEIAAALADAARADRDPAVRAAAAAAPAAAPASDEWRIFDVVEPDDDRPVRAEPYFLLVGVAGPAWATYTDRRGVIDAEHVPADVSEPHALATVADL
ncbi:MAG: HEAT repeat domain-containing protein [Myxococcales bacterium]|nr:HEAT repeat domain-containing protein [Myxococcales bacterium]